MLPPCAFRAAGSHLGKHRFPCPEKPHLSRIFRAPVQNPCFAEAVTKLGTVPSAPLQKHNYQHFSRARVDHPRFFHSFAGSSLAAFRITGKLICIMQRNGFRRQLRTAFHSGPKYPPLAM